MNLQKFTKKPSEWTLDANASYVVVGGLGGLGRAICQWMVSKGAKHLIVLSRSGATTDVAIKTVHDFEKRGVRIAALACDAASREALVATLDSCASTMPPIKGCINSAMALQVILLCPSTLVCTTITDLRGFRMAFLIHFPTPDGATPCDQNWTLPGIFTIVFRKGWISSSCCHHFRGSTAPSRFPTMPRAVPTKTPLHGTATR